MFFDAEVIAASTTHRRNLPTLITMRLTYPRMIHSEFMTHRVFSRNAASSRAIPTKKLLAKPTYIPTFSANQRGMQAGEELHPEVQSEIRSLWVQLADITRDHVEKMAELGGHKQWVNRPLEWFSTITVIVTSTDWGNFKALRHHAAAQPEFQILAELVAKKLEEVKEFGPRVLDDDEWHLPFVTRAEQAHLMSLSNLHINMHECDPAFDMLGNVPVSTRAAIVQSVARCARASYDNFEGTRSDLAEDIELFLKLFGSDPKHMSPFEHQAMPLKPYAPRQITGNFRDWGQFRKFILGECAREE